MTKGANIIVSGVVQGVGFRWFVIRTVEKLNLKGWVRNLVDGNVEVQVEGDRGEIEILIKAIKTGPRSAVVKNVEIEWCEFEGRFSNFDVKY